MTDRQTDTRTERQTDREEEDLSQNGKNSKRKLEKALFLFLADTKVENYP